MTQTQFDPVSNSETSVMLTEFQVYPISSPESLNLAHYPSRIGELPDEPLPDSQWSDGEWLVKHDILARLTQLEIIVARLEIKALRAESAELKEKEHGKGSD